MYNQSILTLCLCTILSIGQSNVQAQSSIPGDENESEQPSNLQVSSDNYSQHKNSLGLNFGIQGVGLDYGRSINNQINLRLRGQALPISLDDMNFSASDQDLLVDLDLEYSNIGLIVDYEPFKNSSFKLMGGASYFLQNTVSGFAELTEPLYFGDDGSDPDDKGDFVFTPEDIGTIDAEFIWADFAPYVGFGFGRTMSKNSIGFAVELGAFYMGSPDINIKATGMIEETAQEEAELEDNLSDINWLPQLNFRLSYPF